jgi:hypothetical protein
VPILHLYHPLHSSSTLIQKVVFVGDRFLLLDEELTLKWRFTW